MKDVSTSADRPQAHPRPTVLIWPGIVFLLLGGQIMLMLVAVYLATSDSSFAVEPDYYRKALRWDETAAQTRLNQQLGWSVEIVVSSSTDIYKNRDVTCILKDGSGREIDDAQIELTAFAHARGDQRVLSELTAVGQGRYGTTLRMTQPGRWEFRIVARRGGDTFTQVQEVIVARSGDPRRWQR